MIIFQCLSSYSHPACRDIDEKKKIKIANFFPLSRARFLILVSSLRNFCGELYEKLTKKDLARVARELFREEILFMIVGENDDELS